MRKSKRRSFNQLSVWDTMHCRSLRKNRRANNCTEASTTFSNNANQHNMILDDIKACSLIVQVEKHRMLNIHGLNAEHRQMEEAIPHATVKGLTSELAMTVSRAAAGGNAASLARCPLATKTLNRRLEH